MKNRAQVNAHIAKGKAFYQKKPIDFTNALKEFEIVVKLDPQNADAWWYVGTCLRNLSKNNLPRTIDCYTKALAIKPNDAGILLSRGTAFYALGKNVETIRDTSKTIQLSPKEGRAYYYRSLAYSEMGKYSLAIADAEKSAQLNPSYAPTWLNSLKTKQTSKLHNASPVAKPAAPAVAAKPATPAVATKPAAPAEAKLSASQAINEKMSNDFLIQDVADEKILNNINQLKILHKINSPGLDKISSILDAHSQSKTLGEIYVMTILHNPVIEFFSNIGAASIEYNLTGILMNRADELLLVDGEAAAALLQAVAWLKILEMVTIYQEKFGEWIAGKIDSRISQIKDGFGLLNAVRLEILRKSKVVSDQSITDFFKTELKIKESDSKNGWRFLRDGNQLLQQKKFQAAIEAFNRVIELLPNTKFVYSQRSQAHEALNNHKQALDDFATYWNHFPEAKFAETIYSKLSDNLRKSQGQMTITETRNSLMKIIQEEPNNQVKAPAVAVIPKFAVAVIPKPAVVVKAKPDVAVKAKSASVKAKPTNRLISKPHTSSIVTTPAKKQSNTGMDTINAMRKRQEESKKLREKQEAENKKRKEAEKKRNAEMSNRHNLFINHLRRSEAGKASSLGMFSKSESSSGSSSGGGRITYSGWDFKNNRYLCGLYSPTKNGGTVLVKNVACPTYLK